MALKSAFKTLENRVGFPNTVDTVFNPETWQESAELTNERRNNANIRQIWYWTANFGLYTVENEEAILYFGGRGASPVTKNLEEVTTQLIRYTGFRPDQDSIQAVINSAESGKTLKIVLSELNLKSDSSEWSYFEIDTVDYETKLNAVQRAFAEKVYGEGNDFVKNMEMLAEAGIARTKIYVLNPRYVLSKVKENGAFVRISSLSGFYGNSNFYACDRLSGFPNYSVRGVPKINNGHSPLAHIVPFLSRLVSHRPS